MEGSFLLRVYLYYILVYCRFPTIFWAPMGRKATPKKYDGGREVSDFIDFLKRESTNPFELEDGKKKKKKKKKAKKDKEEL